MAVSDATWHEVFDRDKGRCQYCGVDLVSSLFAYRCSEIDHLLPIGHPERDKAENLVISCRPCNGSLSRAHEKGCTDVKSRRELLSKDNDGFEQRRKQHFEQIYGWLPLK